MSGFKIGNIYYNKLTGCKVKILYIGKILSFVEVINDPLGPLELSLQWSSSWEIVIPKVKRYSFVWKENGKIYSSYWFNTKKERDVYKNKHFVNNPRYIVLDDLEIEVEE